MQSARPCVRIGQVGQDIKALAPDGATAKALEIKQGLPVLQILRCYIDSKGRVFEISLSHHPGDRFVYSMHIDVES